VAVLDEDDETVDAVVDYTGADDYFSLLIFVLSQRDLNLTHSPHLTSPHYPVLPLPHHDHDDHDDCYYYSHCLTDLA